MCRCEKALQIGMVLAVTSMILVGCGRHERLDREAASEIVVFQMDSKTTQKPEKTPAKFESASMTDPNTTANIAAEPTATPNTTPQKTSEKQISDADIDRLMDDLDTALDELEASTATVDRDTLTDATLRALGK